MTDSCVLDVGTEVSAKYRGAFCEATIKHVKKFIKIRISWIKPLTGSATVTQENIRGVVKVQNAVEAKRDNVWCPATVLKITDASTYTVVFDDGDERTLGRNSVCPQGAKHFNEEWTLDHLPLTNPENFGTPVIMDSKKQRKRRKVEGPDSGRTFHYSEEDVGKVVFYDTRSGKKQTLVPVLIASHGQCDEFVSTNPGEIIVRSFKSGKFMSIPKEDMVRFDRLSEPLESILAGSSDFVVMKPALEKALAFYDTGVLPGTWKSDHDSLIGLKEPDDLNNTKIKKQFTSALSDFWEKKGSPMTRHPSVGYHDLDLYYLHCYVTDCGGPESVTRSLKWRSICAQMNILDIPASGSHTVRNAYLKYVAPFLVEWNRRSSRSKEASSPEVQNAGDTPVIKKKGRGSTPVPLKVLRTPTPVSRPGRRNSVKIEADGEESVASDTTDYEAMPDVHKYNIGQRVKVLYGAPKHCGSYEARINDKNVDSKSDQAVYHIHYTGWNTRYDEWITEDSILSLVTRSSKKKGTLLDPPKDLKKLPNRRKIVPKYKKLLKKQQSTTSETSSDDKNSLPASESSEFEQQVEQQPSVKDELISSDATMDAEEIKSISSPSRLLPESSVTMETHQLGLIDEKADHVVESRGTPDNTTVEVKSEPFVAGDVTSTQVSQEDSKPAVISLVYHGNTPGQSHGYHDNVQVQIREDKSPLLCDENFAECLDESAVSSTQQTMESSTQESHDVMSRDIQSRDVIPRDIQSRDVIPRDIQSRDVIPRDIQSRDAHEVAREKLRYHDGARYHDHAATRFQNERVLEETKAKEEAAAILMTFPSTFAMKGPMTSSGHHNRLMGSPSDGSKLMTSPGDRSRLMTSPGDAGQSHNPHPVAMPPYHLQLSYQYPPKGTLHRFPTSPSKDTGYITTSGCPTQYLTTNSVRPVMAAAGIAKIPGPSQVGPGYVRPGHVVPSHVVSSSAVPGHVVPNHVTSHFMASGTSHFQQQHPPPGFSGNKVNRILPKPGIAGLVVGSDVLQSTNTLKLEEKKKGRKRKIQQADSTSDIGARLQQFDFRPEPCEDCDKRSDERPRRTERDKARRGTVKNSTGGKTGERETTQQPPYWIPGSVVGSSYVRSSTVPLYYTGSDVIQGGYYVPMRPPGIGPYPPGYSPKLPLPIPKSVADIKTEQPSSSGIREPTQAEPDSTVADDKPSGATTALIVPPVAQSEEARSYPRPYNTPPYCTPPHATSHNKRTPNMDSDSSDEKNVVPGMSPLLHSTSECSDKEESTAKVKIFDKDFGIHLFDHLELPDKIKSLQSTMAELQKCYFFYKGQISAIEKKERGKRKSKKRRKSKQRTSSLSKSDKSEKFSEISEISIEKQIETSENLDETLDEKPIIESEHFVEMSRNSIDQSEEMGQVTPEISEKLEIFEKSTPSEENKS